MMNKILLKIVAMLWVGFFTLFCDGEASAFEAVFPYPREAAAGGKRLKLPKRIGISYPAGLRSAVEELRNFCLSRDIVFTAEAPKRALIRLTIRREGTPEHDEGYILDIGPDGADISARAEAGLFYGLQSLQAMLTADGDNELPYCRIVDRPQFDLRGVAFSLRGAGPDKLEQLKKFLRTAAALKYNCAAIEFAENFPYRDDPFLVRNKRLSEADIRDIVNFAEAHFIKVIPLLRIWNNCPMLAAYPRRDELLEVPYGKAMRYSYCPQNPEALRLIGKVVAEQTALLHSKCFIFHLDRAGFRQASRQCAKCRDTALDKLAADHFAELDKTCAASGVKTELIIAADPSRLSCGTEKNKPEKSMIGQCERLLEAPLGHPILTKRKIGRAAANGQRRFVLDGMTSIRGGMLLPLTNNTVYSLGGLVDGAGYMWSGAESRRHPDAVAYFFALFHGKPIDMHPAGAATPVPLDRTVNVPLNNCDDFPAFAPKQLAELAKTLAARPEKFRLTTGRGGSYCAVRLAGERLGDPYPGKAEIALGGVTADAIDLLLSCSVPPQQTEYSPWHGGSKLFSAPQIASVTVNYENGGKWTTKLRYTNGITDWNHPFGGYKLRIAAAIPDIVGRSCHFDALNIKNPHPEQPIRSLVLSSSRHDGISPILLALSLVNVRGANLPAGIFDGLPLSIHPPEKTGRDRSIQWDFEDSSLKNAYVETGNMVFASGMKVKIDYPVDTASPSHDHVLRVTIPPATAENPALPLKLIVYFPWTPRGTVKSLVLSCRIDRPEHLSGAFQILVNTLDKSSYTQEFHPSEKWGVFHSALDNRDALSPNPLRDVRRCNIRKAVFAFTALPQGAEVRLDDVGLSRLRRHDLPAFMAE